MPTCTIYLVNTCVYTVGRSNILPWIILQIKEEECTVQEFFELHIKCRLSFSSCDLHSALVGKESRFLYSVDVSLPLVAVINSFGQFLKYVVSVADAPPTTQISTEISTSLPVTSVVLPINVKNKKNQLFNDILHFLDSFAVTVEDSNKDELKRLVVLLQNTFWHIDGHHHVFEQCALAVPLIFEYFLNKYCNILLIMILYVYIVPNSSLMFKRISILSVVCVLINQLLQKDN